MIQIDKIIENAFQDSCTIKDLFDSANFLIEKGDSKSIHAFLEIGHLPKVNTTIYNNDKVNDWFDLLSKLIKKSNYQISNILEQRAKRYKDKTFFQMISNEAITSISFKETWNKVQRLGSYFQSNLNKSDTVGILSPNHINGALIDLACIAYGIRIVPIPLNLSSEHLKYVLIHADITHLFLGNEQARELLIESKFNINNVEIIQIDNKNEWNDFCGKCSKNKIEPPNLKNLESLTTIMYTSGTTDNPKGIQFNQINIVSKRFARALALPDFGPNDGFLCYLPLYHTFGRWFEMFGSLFWGASYTFTESTSFKTLLRDFKLAKPTIFISIPKRWIQIKEHIAASISIERSTNKEIQRKTNYITGGKLKWGLSAAGFLDPDIFKFFNENKITLLSGYGMTEATGGITMTPPENYIVNSVGKALPGINLKLANDNELLLQGDYVTRGYYKDDIDGTFINNWFHTGDIFNYKKGHYFIVDRKKEIYKNSRGQTISPQKIENLFQDFESIKSVFLIGDGKEFNTLLLYPDSENKSIDIAEMSSDEKRTYYSSLVFSVNSFLPSYERIVNYVIISRDFEHNKDELTTKNTYKRKNIIKNFNHIIKPMYEKNYISLIHGNYEIQIPNWFLRDKSFTRGDLRWDGKSIFQYELKNKLELKWSKSKLKIGNFYYNTSETTISIEKLIRDPNLWIGNQPLVDFVGEIIFRVVSFESYRDFTINNKSLPFNKVLKNKVVDYKNEIPSINDLHDAANNILSKGKNESSFELLEKGLSSPKHQLIIQNLLLKLQFHPDQNNWIKALEILMPQIGGELFINLFKSSQDFKVFKNFNHNTITLEHLKSIFDLMKDYRNKVKISNSDILIGESLIELITDLVLSKPEFYMSVRGELTLWVLVSKNESLSKLARTNRRRMNKEFRKIIINDNYESKFDWGSIIQFDNNIPNKIKKKIDLAIRNSTLIRESVFIFSNGSQILLSDISDDGIWCTLIGQGHGKIVIRVLIQLIDKRAYNFVMNINDTLDTNRFRRETNWLISIGANSTNQKLVEDFGSVWKENQIFTEEYIPGETVLQHLERNQAEIASEVYPDRWQMRWLHFIWNGISAYLEFWKNSGKTQMIADASPRNVIIPEYDYYTGTRLISISGREKANSIYDVLITLYQKFILDTETIFPGLKKMAEWEILFTIVLEVFGTTKGIKLLNKIKNNDTKTGLTTERIQSFLSDVDEFGLLRKSVVFASLRYQRWLDLNPKATHKAKGVIIQDLYKDYKLQSLTQKYPETRIRFFLMTAFIDTNSELIEKLNELMNEIRFGTVSNESLDLKLHQIHDHIELNDSEKYFLTRLVFEHVDAADYAELISRDLGENKKLDLVVLVENKSGEVFKIRPPFHPKEVARFHSHLIDAKLEVQFEVNHEFLLVYNSKDSLVGGVFWRSTGPGIAHFEKIVLAQEYRNKNLSIKLVEDLFQRLKLKKIKYLTVGFFQSGLFYKLGFEINQKFGGLVKKL